MLRGATFGGYDCSKRPPPYQWSSADYDALRAAAKKLNCNEEDLLLVLWAESTLIPNIAHCIGGQPSAIGLNQITWSPAAKAMGMTKTEWLSMLDMTPAEQLPYVVRYFEHSNGGKPFVKSPDLVTLYQYNIAPGTVPNEVIYTAKYACPCPSNASLWPSDDNYCHNSGLDKNKDCVITRTDLADVLAAKSKAGGYQKALAELRGTTPVKPASGGGSYAPSEGSGLAAIVLLGTVVGGGLYLYGKRRS